jgi:hypothetical protein
VLRQLPLDLIHTFLAQQHIPTGPPWAALVDGDTNTLYQAWCDLPAGARETVEVMLRHVHDMASEAAVRAVIVEARHRGHDIADALAVIEGHHAKALWVLVHHAPAFHTARQLLAAASPVGRFWNLTTAFDNRPYDTTPVLANSSVSAEQSGGQQCQPG